MRIPTVAPRIPTADTRRVKPPPKRADGELLTSGHKAWRDAVIARARGLCQGVDHKGDRAGHRLVADHVKERRDGGAALDPANGAALCWSCHTLKTLRERAKRAARRY